MIANDDYCGDYFDLIFVFPGNSDLSMIKENIDYFETDENPQAKEIHNALMAHNQSIVGVPNRLPLVLSISIEGQLVAGLKGLSHWKWLYISHLWVAAGYRRLHYGRHLMERAEIEARERDCVGCYVDTFSLTAVRFYESVGYEIFGKLENFPPPHTRFFLQKYLS